jgi:hypothetical protein
VNNVSVIYHGEKFYQEKNGVGRRENHRPSARHLQTLLHGCEHTCYPEYNAP